jgi:hypothetical protein
VGNALLIVGISIIDPWSFRHNSPADRVLSATALPEQVHIAFHERGKLSFR